MVSLALQSGEDRSDRVWHECTFNDMRWVCVASLDAEVVVGSIRSKILRARVAYAGSCSGSELPILWSSGEQSRSQRYWYSY